MKRTAILSVATVAAATFSLGLFSGTVAVAAYTLTAAASFALILTSDYSSRFRGYAAGSLAKAVSRERLPLAV